MSQRMEKKYPTNSTEKVKKEKKSPSKSSEKGPIIASEWLKFVSSWDKVQDRLVLPNQENCNLQKFKFQIEFGIRAEDQNIYRFTLSLMSLRHDPRIYDEDYYVDRKLSFPITYFILVLKWPFPRKCDNHIG